MALRRQWQAWNVKYALAVVPCEDTYCSPWGPEVVLPGASHDTKRTGPPQGGRAGRKSVWETYRSVLKTLEGLAQGDRDLRRGTALVEVQPRHPVAWVGGDVGAGRLHVVPVGR